MRPRDRRLKADFEKIKAEFHNHPHIKVKYNESEVPDTYFVTYFVKGIKQSEDSKPDNRKVEIIEKHDIEIYLHFDYPRLKPRCVILTSIFHPNFRMSAPNDICIGDHWASGETIIDLIYQIGDMIQYKNYNVKSPLNGIAAKWARENEDKLPIDNIELYRPEEDINLKDNELPEIDLK